MWVRWSVKEEEEEWPKLFLFWGVNVTINRDLYRFESTKKNQHGGREIIRHCRGKRMEGGEGIGVMPGPHGSIPATKPKKGLVSVRGASAACGEYKKGGMRGGKRRKEGIEENKDEPPFSPSLLPPLPLPASHSVPPFPNRPHRPW